MRPMTPENKENVTLKDAVDLVKKAAFERRRDFQELGVFLLFSTLAGDAWLLEITESDCVQLVYDGRVLDVPIDETAETIVIDWTHTFRIKDKKLVVTSYEEKRISILADAPAGQINAAIKRLIKNHSAEVLDQVHIQETNVS